MNEEPKWQLLPSERVLWEGAPAQVARSRVWAMASLLLSAVAIVAVCFAGLMFASDMAGGHQVLSLGAFCAALAIGAFVWPRHRLESVAYAVTNRRVIVQRGRSQRFVDRASITFGRIHWHRASPVVGHLELVVATPFGPLRRQLRILLEDVREPDRLWAMIRGTEAEEGAGDAQQPLVERLDVGEKITWSGRPLGRHIGWREALIAAAGVSVTALSIFYAQTNIGILLNLEGLGLQVKSLQWGLLFSAVLVSWVSIVAIGISLLLHGLVHPRRLGEDSEYVLTDTRLLIRRGGTELSLDRKRIVDVAEHSAGKKLVHLYLVLDGPGARALNDSGAMGPVAPARATVPPVLFGLARSTNVRTLLLGKPQEDD